MDNGFTNKLRMIGGAFGLSGTYLSYEELKNGNVNRTYLVRYAADSGTEPAAYLFQKVNTYAFREPERLMENAEKITAHIRRKDPHALTLRYRHTIRGGAERNYLYEDGEFWRVTDYIPSVTYLSCGDAAVVRGAGAAFGAFQTALSDFDPDELYDTIPGFHDTRKRYADLLASVQNDPAGRKGEVEAELSYLLSKEDAACMLTDLFSEGRLPLRVTHNDTKINNVLFDKRTNQPLAVIDLDTVMPGAVGSDFGDAIRCAANYTEEDSDAYGKVGVDLKLFEAFADGFLGKTAKQLSETEIGTLAQACFSMTCELAARFLVDYLDGDRYFRIACPEHNLVRARNQIALAKDMEQNMDAMRAIVQTLADRYRKN